MMSPFCGISGASMPTGKVTAGRSPIHNHRQGFFVHAMVDFIQILFATERMLDSTEGPAQKRPGPQYSYLTGIRVSVALAPKPLERKEISMQVHSILQGESLNQDLQTLKYRRGAAFNRQHPFVDILLSDIAENGEVLDVSELVREPPLPSFQRM
jgi:hypothetical protein